MNDRDDNDEHGSGIHWGRWLLLGLVVLVAIIIGYGKWRGGPWMAIPAAYQADAEPHYCIALARDAQGLSYKQLLLGWLLLSLAALSGLIGGVLGSPGMGNKAVTLNNFMLAYRGILLLGLASMLTAGGMHLLDRSKAATEAAMTATQAIALLGTQGTSGKDSQTGSQQAYKLCVLAKSDWLQGRTDYSRIAELTAQLGKMGNEGNTAVTPANGNH